MRNLAHQTEQGLVLSTTEHILHVLARKADVPLLILVDDILRTGYRHRQDKEQGCPSYQCSHKLHLVLGKEKECQPHDTIKLHEGSDHDEAGGRNILFFLYAIERSDDDGGNDDVKLAHKQCREQLMGTEPIAEYLLALTQRQLTDGNKQGQRHQYMPEQQTQRMGQHCKRSNDNAEERTIVVRIEKLRRILGIQ